MCECRMIFSGWTCLLKPVNDNPIIKGGHGSRKVEGDLLSPHKSLSPKCIYIFYIFLYLYFFQLPLPRIKILEISSICTFPFKLTWFLSFFLSFTTGPVQY